MIATMDTIHARPRLALALSLSLILHAGPRPMAAMGRRAARVQPPKPKTGSCFCFSLLPRSRHGEKSRVDAGPGAVRSQVGTMSVWVWV